MSITLESLKTEFYTQKQIQDENVKYGLARCKNETKAKSLQKLTQFLSTVKPADSCSVKPADSCSIQINNDMPINYKYPVGKTKDELIAHIYNFFNT
jgi:hypothetical protein